MAKGKFIVTNDEKTRLEMERANMILIHSGKETNGNPYYIFARPDSCSFDFDKKNLKFGFTDTLFY